MLGKDWGCVKFSSSKMDVLKKIENVLTDPLPDAIAAATSEMLLQPDWGANLEIVEALKAHPEWTRDAVKIIRHRLKKMDPRIVNLTLTLLEMCMKNCGFTFHNEVATKDFMQTMEKIATKSLNTNKMVENLKTPERKRAEQQNEEKARALIETWAEAYEQLKTCVPEIKETLRKLRMKGVRFPRRTEEEKMPKFTTIPVNEFSSEQMRVVTGGSRSGSRPQRSQRSQQRAMIKMEHLELMQQNASLLKEVLKNLQPGEDPTLNDLVVELVDTCSTMHSKLIDTIPMVENEELMIKMLQISEEVSSVLQIAERPPALEASTDRTGKPQPKPAKGRSANEENLLDLDVGAAGNAVENDDDDDEFDSLALRRGGAGGEGDKGKNVAVNSGLQRSNSSSGSISKLAPPPGGVAAPLAPPPGGKVSQSVKPVGPAASTPTSEREGNTGSGNRPSGGSLMDDLLGLDLSAPAPQPAPSNNMWQQGSQMQAQPQAQPMPQPQGDLLGLNTVGPQALPNAAPWPMGQQSMAPMQQQQMPPVQQNLPMAGMQGGMGPVNLGQGTPNMVSATGAIPMMNQASMPQQNAVQPQQKPPADNFDDFFSSR